jgi:hypothetical protein
MKLDDLGQRLRERDPAAVLVPPTALARLVQNVMGITWAVWKIPHSHCLSIARATLHRYIEQEELYLPPGYTLPETVLVLERPSADQLAFARTDELLTRYWRLLFHACLHRALDIRMAHVSDAELRERIERLGPVAFEEARNVLIEDGQLVDGADDRTAYIEFVTFYLELRFFANNLATVYFPSLPDLAEVDALLRLDVDGEAIFEYSRLRGAPLPTPKTDDQSDESEDFYRRLTQSAERALTAGDTVAAAILHTRAARVAPALKTEPAQARAREAIYKLVERLQSALGLTDPTAQAEWNDVLPRLLDKADQGARTEEAALLHDLQRACLDVEQTIYTLDIWDWISTFGHKPIRRPLDSQRYVRVPEHLRSAIRRLAAARLSDADRQRLGVLLRTALNRAEERLRERFRPVLTDALCDAGLKPHSLPEQAALEKTVEELLDRISSTGFLAYADLRDAIARGQMKLADLSGPIKPFHSDPLLGLDRRLAHQLDGVYRRAEPYTLGLEFLTSLAFGTQGGRVFTLNCALPFGGAFLGAEFVWLLVYEQRRRDPSDAKPEVRAGETARTQTAEPQAKEEVTTPAAPAQTGATVAIKPAEDRPDFFAGWNAAWQFHMAWLLLGVFILTTIHSPSLRNVLRTILTVLYRSLKLVLWELPVQIWNAPLVQAVWRSLVFQLTVHYIINPLAVCGLLWLLAPSTWRLHLWTWGIIFLIADYLLNADFGRKLGFLLLEAARGVIELVRAGPAVIRWINDQFRFLVNGVEWALARTEDWFRIRGRGSAMSVTIRAVASIIWMPFAILIRFYTVVLIEPMINPLKLPLSILFAKFVYPLLAVLKLFTISPIDSPLVTALEPILSRPVAWALVIGTFYLSPDLFTFLFWEMRENWRLYRANRPDKLKAVAVGPHGETVRGLLHIGFHSGTVPRLYARLRAAEVEAAHTDVWRDARTYRQALRGVEEAVRQFVTRDLVAIVNSSEEWTAGKLAVGEVFLGTNRIRVQLTLDGAPDAVWLEWEERSKWLVAVCAEAGFLKRLPSRPLRIFENALVYLYRRAGVDLIREQVRAVLPREAVRFYFSTNGLLVWYGSRETQPLLYDPNESQEELRPRNPGDRRLAPGPNLPANRLIFSRLELTWPQWLAVWQGRDLEKPPRFGPADWELKLLPPG